MADVMEKTTTQHATFVIERTFDAPPSLVFQTWADKEAKANWFRGGPEWKEIVRKQDFRVGGEDELSGEWRANGTTSTFKSRYFDIVKDQRIIYAYEMFMNGKKISTSLATVEFRAEGKKTAMTLTEQGAFIDGHDDAGSRERGVRAQMDMLADALKTR
jgi:uncharacterized protein YndB with AHSA1/START domain